MAVALTRRGLNPKTLSLTIAVVMLGCSTERAKAVDEPDPNASKIVQHKSPVPHGKHVLCTDVLNATTIGAELQKELTVTQAKDKTVTASCELRLAGKRPTEKEQERIIKAKGKLGVMPGDVWCNVKLHCWFADLNEKLFEKRCLQKQNQLDKSLGAVACIQVTPVAHIDSYTYRILDNDSKCMLEVRGGPSVTKQDDVASCAKAAMNSVTRDGIAKIQ